MGDIENIEMNECYREDPHSGEMAVKVTLSTAGELGWGGVYWQYPENNWGDLPESLNLSWANKVTFWAKGETGSERIRFFVGGIGIASDPYHDSLRPAVDTGFIQLTTQWKQYTINLVGQDLSQMIGGFGWAADRCADPAGATFYLDDIYFEYEPNLQPPPPYSSPFKLYSDAGAQDNHFIPSGWLGDATVAGRMDLTECWLTNPHLGSTCIRIVYSQEVIGWTGVYWMHPAENWGDRPGGINLQGATRLSFWARSETPNLPVKFVIGGVGYAEDYQGDAVCSQPIQPYPDSVCPKVIAVKNLQTQWTQYTITLPMRNYSRVVGGFAVVMETPGVVYLDDIAYEW
jgi:hypothetical protein